MCYLRIAICPPAALIKYSGAGAEIVAIGDSVIFSGFSGILKLTSMSSIVSGSTIFIRLLSLFGAGVVVGAAGGGAVCTGTVTGICCVGVWAGGGGG